MAAERVTDLLRTLEGLGLNADIASRAIATVMAGIESDLRAEIGTVWQPADNRHNNGKK